MRGGRALSWTALVLAIVVCLASAYAAYTLAGYSWDQVVSYRTPFGDYDRPWVAAKPTAFSAEESSTPRVVLVIVDGLQLEASRNMSSLNTLRQYGADMVAITPQPSLSFPTWTNILSGAPPQFSGVTTNWFEGAVPVETLIDVALAGGRTVVVSAPDDFDTLYGASRAQASYFRPWGDGEYMTGDFVDQAISMTDRVDPQLVVVHLPDADETAHDAGADSTAYADVVASIDRDIARLVEALQDERTTYVICADHGHISSGGHGGWERDVTRTPAVFVGARMLTERGEISQSDIAPTLAAVLGLPIPAHSAGRVRGDLLADSAEDVLRGERQFRALAERYATVIGGTPPSVGGANTYDALQLAIDDASSARLTQDRRGRLLVSLAIVAAALAVVGVVGLTSWRALVASLAGAVAYFGLYNALYFLLHGYEWSLSAFNTETFVEMFFNIRMAEAALSLLVASSISAYVYPLLRRRPRGPKAGFAAGWLTLGPTTALCVLSGIAVQVAWFLWAWGADVTWRLPDLKWGFKYDLDLIQATAVGAVAILTPLVTYLVGRYHPKVRLTESAGSAARADGISGPTP